MLDILGLVIGMVFAFLLLSLLATMVQEIIASILSMRGKFLLDALVQLLELDWVDESELAGTTEGERIKELQAKRKAKKTEWTSQIQKTRVYQKFIHKNAWIKRLPSYLSADQVISILQELMVDPIEEENQEETEIRDQSNQGQGGVGELRDSAGGRIEVPDELETPGAERLKGSALPRGMQPQTPRALQTPKEPKLLKSMKQTNLRGSLQQLYIATKEQQKAPVSGSFTDPIIEGNLRARSLNIDPQAIEKEVTEKFNKIKKEITTDFNGMMDRASGWYKKRAQTVLFLIGLTIAFAFDADTFVIYQSLSNNAQARQEVLTLADQFVTNNQAENFAPATQAGANAEDQLLELRKQANVLVANEIAGLESALGFGRDKFPESPPQKAGEPDPTLKQIAVFRFVKFMGWIVTALAISLGATFWFDILKQLINIRNAGVKPSGGTGA